MLILGCQVSIAGKIYEAIGRAKALGCNTLQIFTRNPRQWRKSSLEEEEIELFKKRRKEEGIRPVVVHIPYTLNLATVKAGFYKITIREFRLDLLEADSLGVEYLVTHLGSYKGGTERQGLKNIAQALRIILEEAPKVKTMILLENTSGSGHWLGYKFSHFRKILEALGWSKRIGICLDTAHAWAGGYKIDTLEGLEGLLKEIDREVGLERLKVIHLNDTKEKLNSRRDRHLDIGEGLIGENGFRAILNHPKLRNLPFILETPKKSNNDDLRNLKRVRQLYQDEVH